MLSQPCTFRSYSPRIDPPGSPVARLSLQTARQRRTLLPTLPLLVSLWTLPTLLLDPAAATARPPAARREAQARRHFRLGEAAFAKGDFRGALVEYDRAFRLVPLAGLLFNIGQCHRNLGAHERAIYSFQLYLARAPQATNRAAVLALIAELKPLVARAAPATGTAGAAKPPTDGTTPGAGGAFGPPGPGSNQDVVVGGDDASAGAVGPNEGATGSHTGGGLETGLAPANDGDTVREQALLPQPTPPAQPSPPIYRRWWFWTALSTAVVAGVTAVGVHYGQQPRHHTLPASNLPTWALDPVR